jgi:catechol 2,3-dioxygenase
MIGSISHIALRVPNLDDAVAHAVTVLGLREVERLDGTAYLTHGTAHHSLQYIQGSAPALDHISLQASSGDGFAQLRERLKAGGVPILSEEPQEPGLCQAMRFLAPAGHVIEVHTGIAQDQPEYHPAGVRPRRFGHVVLTADGPETTSFFLNVLGFRISDVVGNGVATFMRCNVDHHSVGVFPGASGMHHYAWEVDSLAEIGRLGDTLDSYGKYFYWGPVRHGTGGNIAAYHFEPAGALVEYYTGLLRIYDEESYTPGRWELQDPRGVNVWGRTSLPDGYQAAGIPIVEYVSDKTGGAR